MPKHKKVEDDRTFEVTVWNTMDGDIIKKRWDATLAEAGEIEEEFRDEPFTMVQVDER